MPGKKEQASKRRVAFYGGCLIDFVYPQVGEAVIKVLKHYGVEVHFPPGQTCCGAPAKFSGATDGARKMARQNIEAFSPEDYEAVISACPQGIKGTFPFDGRGTRCGESPELAEKVGISVIMWRWKRVGSPRFFQENDCESHYHIPVIIRNIWVWRLFPGICCH